MAVQHRQRLQTQRQQVQLSDWEAMARLYGAQAHVDNASGEFGELQKVEIASRHPAGHWELMPTQDQQKAKQAFLAGFREEQYPPR